MGSLVPLLGRDCQARDKELPGQTRNFPLHLTGRLVTPTALGQGHCPPSRTRPCGQVAPCCSLVVKGCPHIARCVHYWGLRAALKAFSVRQAVPCHLHLGSVVFQCNLWSLQKTRGILLTKANVHCAGHKTSTQPGQ